MDLNKKAGQLLVIGFEGKEVPEKIKDLIHNYHIGGIILFSRNIGTPGEVLNLTTELQQEARNAGYEYPLLICVDQENGVVRRLGEGFTTFPGSMTIGSTDNAENAYEIGLATGKELQAVGVNWNLAPVVDVNNNPDNPVIGVRSFSDLPEKVASFGQAIMNGMQDSGTITTLKHFPGHGDTNVDSHLDLPVVPHSMERLEKVELVPFKACISSGADVIMTAHVCFPAIERVKEKPATLSANVITKLLKERLGFNGVVITDCMEMNAISNTIGTENGSVAAIKAGADLIMISHTLNKQEGALKKIIQAIENGEIDEKLIDKSIERINVLKQKYLSWENVPTKSNLKNIKSKQHQDITYKVYRKSIKVIKNEGIIPLSIHEKRKILVISPENNKGLEVEDKKHTSSLFGKAVQEYVPFADIYKFPPSITDKDLDELMNKLENYDTVIIGWPAALSNKKQAKVIKQLVNSKSSVVVVSMRNPYNTPYLADASAIINTYEDTYPALKVAASLIFDKGVCT